MLTVSWPSGDFPPSAWWWSTRKHLLLPSRQGVVPWIKCRAVGKQTTQQKRAWQCARSDLAAALVDESVHHPKPGLCAFLFSLLLRHNPNLLLWDVTIARQSHLAAPSILRVMGGGE